MRWVLLEGLESWQTRRGLWLQTVGFLRSMAGRERHLGGSRVLSRVSGAPGVSQEVNVCFKAWVPGGGGELPPP